MKKKCPICLKGKSRRVCMIKEDQMICSKCCAEIRNNDCVGCEHYKTPQETRKYNKIPSYAPNEMEQSMLFQDVSDNIESAFCSIDERYSYNMTDDEAKKILERLLDKYHYKDNTIVCEKEIIEIGFNYIDNIVKTKLLKMVDNSTLIRILGAIHFILVRRSTGKREYFDVIHKYVGNEDGVRIMGKL